MFIPILILVTIILRVNKYYQIQKKNNKEYFRSYEDIQENRDNLCDVYIDTFFNSHINTREEVKDPFMRWCNNFKKEQRHYPEHRAAERVFLKFNEIYGRQIESYN